jgi:hypothetical protein
VGNNGGRERALVRVLVDLNVGEPKKDIGGRSKRYLYLLGVQRLLWVALPAWMGGTAVLPITARFENCFDGCYGRV